MTIKKRATITLLILGVVVLLFVSFIIKPILVEIRKESDNIIIQKKERLELETKIKNIQDFKNNYEQYRPNLEKIGRLYINAAEPVEFIEFLERQAGASRLSIRIVSSAAFNFGLNLEGSFPDFLRFLEKLEYGPYLIEPLNLSVRKILDEKDEISAVLLIKAK